MGPAATMRALILTNEYPPNVYGGAGVHVEYLTRELARLIDVEVRCLRRPGPDRGAICASAASGRRTTCSPRRTHAAARFSALEPGRSRFAAEPVDADVVHCHTWYTHLGGILAKLAYGIPLVITTHSLEPLRPWKREQLGGGYDVSPWVEQTAHRDGRRGDRGLPGHARRRAAPLRRRAGARPRHPQRHRPRRVPPDQRSDAALERHGDRPGRARTCCSSAGSPGRRASSTWSARSADLDPRLPGRPVRRRARHAGDRRGDGGRGRRGAGRRGRASSGSTRCSTSRRVRSSTRTPRSSAARRSTSRSGSSTSRRWPARRAVVASAVGGIPEVVVDGETGLLVPFEASDSGAFEPADAGSLRGRPRPGDRRAHRRSGAAGGDGRGRAAPGGRALRLAGDRRARTVELYRFLLAGG